MHQEPSNRLAQLIASARPLPRSQWREHLNALAADAPELVEQALATLAAEADAATESVDANLRRLRQRPTAGDTRYERLEEVGRGGMGEVLRVHDKDLRRHLAMKLVTEVGTSETVDPELLQRFLDEAKITGQLDHPGVVPVHDLGIDATGRAWFTMRLVKGDTADTVFERARTGSNGWTLTRAIEVLLKVCDTMAFAHKKGVLHRDLKPSNVMVGAFGEVYVMDWGLAKVRGQSDKHDLRIRPESTITKVRTDRSKQEADGDSPLLTMDGAVVGTPCYMAPEQAEGRIEGMDQRSDVYSVGAMLYELLTGHRPYVARGARVNQHVVLASVLMGPPREVTSLDKNAPAELVAICKKAMARQMDDRYPDMVAMATDLRAFVERKVVIAYRTGPVAELVSWVRRNRALASSLIAVFLIAAVAAIGMSSLYVEAEQKSAELSLAAKELGKLVTKSDELSEQRRSLLEEASKFAFRQADRLFEVAQTNETEASPTMGELEGLLLMGRAVSMAPRDPVALERLWWEMQRLPQRVETWSTKAAEPEGFSFGRDGSLLFVTGSDSSVRVHEARSGKLVATLPHAAMPHRVRDFPFGLAVSCTDESLTVWDTATWNRITTIAEAGHAMHYSAKHGILVSTVNFYRGAHAFDVRTWERRYSLDHAGVTAMNRSGDLLAAGLMGYSGNPETCFVHRVADGVLVRELTDAGAGWPEFSRDGLRLLTKTRRSQDRARLHDTSTWDVVAEWSKVEDAEFTPSGTRLLVVREGGTELMDARTGAVVHAMPSDVAQGSPTILRVDEGRARTSSRDTLYEWSWEEGTLNRTELDADADPFNLHATDYATLVQIGRRARRVHVGSWWNSEAAFDHASPVAMFWQSPDGASYVTASKDSSIRTWHTLQSSLALFVRFSETSGPPLLSEGRLVSNDGATFDLGTLRPFGTPTFGQWCPELLSGGIQLANEVATRQGIGAVCFSDHWTTYDLATRTEINRNDYREELHQAVLSDSGRFLATAGNLGLVEVWKTTKQPEPACVISFESSATNRVSWHRHSERLLAMSFDGSARVWDARLGLQPYTIQHLVGGDLVGGEVCGSFSDDGLQAATGVRDLVQVWSVQDGAVLQSFEHEDTDSGTAGLCWSADGSALAIATGNGICKVWNLKSRVLLAEVGRRAVGRTIEHLNLSMDSSGCLLAVLSQGTASLWHLPSQRLLVEFEMPAWSSEGGSIDVSNDGLRWVFDGGGGVVAVLDRTAANHFATQLEPSELPDLLQLVELAAAHRIDELGKFSWLEPTEREERMDCLRRVLERTGPLSDLVRSVFRREVDSPAVPSWPFTRRELFRYYAGSADESLVYLGYRLWPDNPLGRLGSLPSMSREARSRVRREAIADMPDNREVGWRACSILLGQADPFAAAAVFCRCVLGGKDD